MKKTYMVIVVVFMLMLVGCSANTNISKITYPNDYTIEYVYNNTGKLIEEIHLSRDGSNRTIIGYEYDDSGNKIKSTTNSTFSGLSYSTYTYENDLLVEELDYSSDGNVERRYVFSYDDTQKIVKEIMFYSDDYYFITYYHYDEFGNLIRENFCNADDYIINQTKYEYQYDKKNQIEQKTESISGEPTKNIYTYDKGKIIRKSVLSMAGREQSYIEYEYDRHGRLTTETNVNGSEKEITTYEYLK